MSSARARLIAGHRNTRWWLPMVAAHPAHQFGLDPVQAARHVAGLNIGAYKSRAFDDWHMLSALPSSRMSVTWAQSILFPEAEAGNRMVVCLRSARWWGLDTGTEGKRYGAALYAPVFTRGGVIRHGEMRNAITARMREIISTTPA